MIKLPSSPSTIEEVKARPRTHCKKGTEILARISEIHPPMNNHRWICWAEDDEESVFLLTDSEKEEGFEAL